MKYMYNCISKTTTIYTPLFKPYAESKRTGRTPLLGIASDRVKDMREEEREKEAARERDN